MFTLTNIARLAAGLGGALWTVKALVITVRDGYFDPLESFVFIGGLLAIVVGAVSFAVLFARRYRGVARVAATAVGAVVLVAATSLVELTGLTVVSGLAPGDNLGLEQEGGILFVGLGWLAVAVALRRAPATAPRAVMSSRRPTRARG